jgi:phosphoribosyl-dephospho-CoA transferase
MSGRHQLLRVTPAAWSEAIRGAACLLTLYEAGRNLVGGWAERGWPVIRRRPVPGEAPDGISVGLPLPPALGKLRLGFVVAAEGVLQPVAPVTLVDVLPAAPDAWQAQLSDVLRLGIRCGVRPRVFGALLWQHLTGLTYLHPGSDIDLIWPAPPSHALDMLLEGLEAIDNAGPLRLDGEIISRSGAGVNWRELWHERGKPDGVVLAKSLNGAELTCVRELFVQP